MSSSRVPRRASSKGGFLLIFFLAFVLPGMLVALPVGLLMITGKDLPPGELSKGYGLASALCIVTAGLLAGANAYRNRSVRPIFDEVARRTSLTVDGASFMGDIALLGVRDGIALEVAFTVPSSSRRAALVGTAADAAPDGLKAWAFAPEKRDAAFGSPPMPPFVSPTMESGWRLWSVPLDAVEAIDLGESAGGAIDDQGQRVTSFQIFRDKDFDADELEGVVDRLLAAHIAWAPPRA